MHYRGIHGSMPDLPWRPPVSSSAVAMAWCSQVLIGREATGWNRFPSWMKSLVSMVSLAQAVQSAVHPPGPIPMGVASFL